MVDQIVTFVAASNWINLAPAPPESPMRSNQIRNALKKDEEGKLEDARALRGLYKVKYGSGNGQCNQHASSKTYLVSSDHKWVSGVPQRRVPIPSMLA